MKKNMVTTGILLLILSSLLFLVAYNLFNIKIISWPAIGLGFPCLILAIILLSLKALGIKNTPTANNVRTDEFQAMVLNFSARLSFWITDITLFIFLLLIYVYLHKTVNELNVYISALIFGYFLLHNLIAFFIYLYCKNKFNK